VTAFACSSCGSRAPLCDVCIEQRISWLAGAANLRGDRWAGDVATKVGTAKPWPAFDGRCAAIARHKVEDLGAGEARLEERLARLCWEAAAARYAKLRAGS
jgi:hypothetical protein